jgi:ribosomal protein S18 acetylase RimI-like enzyme
VLPAAVYAHLNPGVDRFFQQHFHLVPHGRHVKMALVHPEMAAAYQGRSVARLDVDDAPAITALFDAAYPGNFFDPRMLETGMYFGSWEGDQLVSVAGIHVYSEAYDVAAIGNVTTHPNYRGRGLAKQVMASLIEALRQRVGTISLNVQQENQAAIHAYTALGFETISEYDEFECYRR